jgi:redox-sensitive bicupin YhaK (pirin superfamily)
VGSSIQSEPTELKACGSRLFGLQTWVALPAAYEEIDPSFVHYEEADLPVFDAEGKRVRLVGRPSLGPPFAREDVLRHDLSRYKPEPGAALPPDTAHEERAVYVVSGVVNIGGDRFPSGQLLVLRPDSAITLRNANEAARIVLVAVR